MRKKFLSAFLLGVLAIATTGTITSCKDYDDDISSLKNQTSNLEKQIATLQSALDQAKADANAAHATFALKSDLQALQEEVAKLVTAAQLQKAIDDCKAALQGGYNGTMKDLANSIDGIDSRLNTLETTLNDPETGLAAAHKNIQLQKEALEAYKKEVEKALGTKVDQTVYDAEVKKIEKALSDLEEADKALKADIDQLKKDMKELDKKINAVAADLNVLTVFVNNRLTSLVLRPDMYYGGIEAVKIFNVNTPVEEMNDEYHYFLRVDTIDLPSMGVANYHVNPSTADLSNTKINFYSWVADINKPATKELVRATDGNANYVWPVWDNYADLVKNFEQEYATIITVPFKANITAIDAALAKSTGVIMALQLTQKVTEEKDTTITSDYALVKPVKGYQLLVCDNSFVDENGIQTHNDQICTPGYEEYIEYGTMYSSKDYCDNNHLHRSFDYLAKSNVVATHEVYYKGAINISKLLTTHYINNPETEIEDTLVHPNHKGSWHAYNNGKTKYVDGNASVDPEFCVELTAADMKGLGLHYEINPVSYTLGTNGTDQKEHIELIEDANGDVIAYPRSVTKDAGVMIPGKEAEVGAVGRMPILCIELKNEAGQTLSFGYMKLVITDKAKETEFKVGPLYADCNKAEGGITWHQWEVQMLEETAGLSQEAFNNLYEGDYYYAVSGSTEPDVTSEYKWNNMYQYDYDEATKQYTEKPFDKPSATNKYKYGEIRWRDNYTGGGTEDQTSHILYWYFSKQQYFALFEKLMAEGNLKDNNDGSYVNTVDISTYVYFFIGNRSDTRSGIFVKMTIPAGKYHFAKGDLGGAKLLASWYQLNSGSNATSSADAKEVRVNVPTPQPAKVPGVRETTEPRVKGGDDICSGLWDAFAEGSWDGENDVTDIEFLHSTKFDGAAGPALATPMLTYYNDDVLEDYEFIKDLHEYFIDGKLTASIEDKENFDDLAKSDIVPEFEFTLPSKALGNATFDADENGQWVVMGATGTEYTLALNATNTEILVVKVDDVALATPVVIACLNDDLDGVQSVIKYHQNLYADDILNFKGHKELGERETFTAYIKITTPKACAPVIFSDSWFNVRFVRPVELSKIPQQAKTDAPNAWQYIELKGAAIDWRNYPMVENTNKGVDKKEFDRSYYQIGFYLYNGIEDIMTDANLGTAERDAEKTAGKLKDVNADPSYLEKCIKVGSYKEIELKEVTEAKNVGASIKLAYKNNSQITGKYNLFIPVVMRYVFGQRVGQVTWATVGINCSVDQPEAK